MEKDIDFESTNTQLTNRKTYQAQIVWTTVVAVSVALLAFYQLAKKLPPSKMNIPTIQVVNVQQQPMEVGFSRAIAGENPEPIPVVPVDVDPR
jgi:hypothetical protein